MLSDEDVEQYRRELAGDENIEDTFQQLRRDGRTRLEALRIILDVLDVSLSEAKHILHETETWGEAWAAGDASTGEAGPSSTDDAVPPAPG